MKVWQFAFDPSHLTREKQIEILRRRNVKSVFLDGSEALMKIFAQSDDKVYKGVSHDVQRLVIMYSKALELEEDEDLKLEIQCESLEYFSTLGLKDQVSACSLVNRNVVGRKLRFEVSLQVMELSVKETKRLKMSILLEKQVFLTALAMKRNDIVDSIIERMQDPTESLNLVMFMISLANTARFRNAIRFCKLRHNDETGEVIVQLLSDRWRLVPNEKDPIRAKMLRQIAPQAKREIFDSILSKSSNTFVTAFDEKVYRKL